MSYRYLKMIGLCLLLCACGARPPKPSEGHIRDEIQLHAGSIPEPVRQTMALPPPKRSARLETYSVVVTGVPAQEILFALARDARINLDIHSGIQGVVTLNAIDQTLPQILDRIAKQVDIRYEMDGSNLVVMPDVPFLRNYKINYVNMSRDTSSNVGIATQIATPGSAGSGGGTIGTNDSGNVSVTSIKNVARNNFWETLEKNVRDLLRETDKILPAGIGAWRVADIYRQTDAIHIRKEAVINQYQAIVATFPHFPVPVEQMKAAVSLIQGLPSAVLSPQQFLAGVSRELEQFPMIQINPDNPLAIFCDFEASCKRSPRYWSEVGSNGYH